MPDIPIGTTYINHKWDKVLRLSEKYYVNIEPVTIEEALQDKDAVRSLLNVAKIFNNLDN